MSFARPRNTPNATFATTLQRQMERQIDERCADHQAAVLSSIKKAAAPKLKIDPADWERHDAAVKLHRDQHLKKVQHQEEMLRQANRANEATLYGIKAQTTFELRRSVTERASLLQEASSAKRHAEAAREAKNKRHLNKVVAKAKPRTEAALPSEVLAKSAALDEEKRSKAAAAKSEIVAANKAATRRLQKVARAGIVCGALAAHAAAHEQARQEMEQRAAEKRLQEARNAKANRKMLEKVAAAARPKTLVSLSPEHGAKLSELAQLSEQKAKAERAELKQHEAKLNALTAGSARKIELPPLEQAAAARAGAAAGVAERRAATVIQAARRGSVGRSDADMARRALARRSALTPGALPAGALPDASRPSDEPSHTRTSIGKRTVAAAECWLAAQSRLKQRRPAITPVDQQAVAEAAAAAAAAAA